MNASAARGEFNCAISDISAPPMKDLGPAPVRTMPRRSSFWDVIDSTVFGSCSRRGVLRAFSLAGREIVRWAIDPVVLRVMLVRIVALGGILIFIIDSSRGV